MIITEKRIAMLILLGLVCVFTLSLRLTFDLILDDIIDMQLKERLPLKKGSFAYKFWVKPPVPVDFRIYVFDIVNPEEVRAGTEVPSVVERGPYVYKMHLKKTHIKFHPDNDTVEYRQPQEYVFDRESSVGPDTDTFTTINIPFVTVANLLQYQAGWLKNIVDLYFRSQNEAPLMRRSVRDIWWGYEDPVLKQATELAKSLGFTSPILTGKFGFYMDRNNTDDGLFNIFSGLDGNFTQYAMIDRWNGMRHQSCWTTDYANRIVGSGDGSMQPPLLTKHSNLSLFDTNLRRTLKLEYNKSTTFKGVDVLHFLLPYSEFASAKDNPDNAGYCTPDTNNCPPSGTINMSAVSYTAPLLASLPHFLGGDPYYQRQVKGLKPSPEKHQPFYEYHAITGVALNAARRYQLNVKTQRYDGFEAFRRMADAYVPVLWIDGVAVMDEDTMHLFKTLMQDTLDSMVYVKMALVGTTCLSVFIAIFLIMCWRWKDKKLAQSIVGGGNIQCSKEIGYSSMT